MEAKILIVEDDRVALRNLDHIMKKEGYETTGTTSGSKGLELLQNNSFDLVLTELKMQKVDGIEILQRCRDLYPDTEVIIITAHASIPSAVHMMKMGAYHYIEKPFEQNEVIKAVRDALEKVSLQRENARLREQVKQLEGKVKIITQNPQMQRLLETARQIAPTDCNVVITGESGTGKELFARYVHFSSRRESGPFFAINCGALTAELLSNELFGHEEGAFTGADKMKKGLIEIATGGTLFLDEITEMSPSMQVKLLRVIQEREIMRLGGTKPIKVDVRLIAATNRDMLDSIKSGLFRQDLFFRLNVVSLNIPPLSERRNDIPLLCQFFLRRYSVLMKKDVREISPKVTSILMNYDFPGNIRELENIIERGMALSSGTSIEEGHLPDDLKLLSVKTFRKKDNKIPSLEEQEMAYISWVLKEVGGNKTLAAQMLGIDRTSLWRKMKKYGLSND